MDDRPAKKAHPKNRSNKTRINQKKGVTGEKNPEYYKNRITIRLSKLNNKLISATRRKERIEHYTRFICNKANSLLESAVDNRESIKDAKDRVEKILNLFTGSTGFITRYKNTHSDKNDIISKSLEEFKKTNFIEETRQSSEKIKEFDSVLNECLALLSEYFPDTEKNSIIEESPENSMNNKDRSKIPDSFAFSPGIAPPAASVAPAPPAASVAPAPPAPPAASVAPAAPFSPRFNLSRPIKQVFNFGDMGAALNQTNQDSPPPNIMNNANNTRGK